MQSENEEFIQHYQGIDLNLETSQGINFKNLELNFRLNQENKVVEIFIDIITKDNNNQKLPPLKWQTIKIDPITEN